MALLSHQHDAPGNRGINAQVIDVALTGRPSAQALADWIEWVADAHGVRCVAIDGPLGWRRPDTDSPHCRLSERAVRAPGKTGLPPDGVKPRNYLAFTTLSIELFERLTANGWTLPDANHTPTPTGTGRYVTETFPTAAWRALGLTALPGKSRSKPGDIPDWLARLGTAVAITTDGVHTHDQLQAVVGGIAPLWWIDGAPERVTLVGAPPVRLGGSWREGHIMIPHVTIQRATND